MFLKAKTPEGALLSDLGLLWDKTRLTQKPNEQ